MSHRAAAAAARRKAEQQQAAQTAAAPYRWPGAQNKCINREFMQMHPHAGKAQEFTAPADLLNVEPTERDKGSSE